MLIITAIAAVIPTALSALGMIAVGIDALRMQRYVAYGLAGFLELALVASALSARDAIKNGRSARVDLAATWVLSCISGIISAAHEVTGQLLITRQPAMTALAAMVRIVAPLVACWLWHRVVASDAASRDARTWTERQEDKVLLNVAVAARRVALEDNEKNREALDRAHVALLRQQPNIDENIIQAQVARLALVDTYPTLVRDTLLAHHEGRRLNEEALRTVAELQAKVNTVTAPQESGLSKADDTPTQRQPAIRVSKPSQSELPTTQQELPVEAKPAPEAAPQSHEVERPVEQPEPQQPAPVEPAPKPAAKPAPKPAAKPTPKPAAKKGPMDVALDLLDERQGKVTEPELARILRSAGYGHEAQRAGRILTMAQAKRRQLDAAPKSLSA